MDSNKIAFGQGIKEYSINGKCTVAFNPADGIFAEKLYNAFDRMEKMQDGYKAQISKMGNKREIFDKELASGARAAATKALKVAITTIIGALIGAVFGGGIFGGIVGGVIGLTFGLAITFGDAKIRGGGFGSTSSGSFGGRSVPSIQSFSIPALATGSVIPPNREFLAVLGDNKKETEVVSPLSTIEQALENVMSRMGSASPQQINLVVDGKVLAKVVVPKINDMTRQAGRSVLLI